MKNKMYLELTKYIIQWTPKGMSGERGHLFSIFKACINGNVLRDNISLRKKILCKEWVNGRMREYILTLVLC